MQRELKKKPTPESPTPTVCWIGIPEDITPYYGFVYKITHTPSGRYYIGKKFFWFKHSGNPLKGKTRKRKYLAESDWRTYWSSSAEVQALVASAGEHEFTKEVIHLCKDKFECAYYEVKYQMDHKVLYDCQSFNKVINCRIRRINKEDEQEAGSI